MPPVDDPLARLCGRAVFADTLTTLWDEANPSRGSNPWPRYCGKQFDLYVLFEAVKGLGGLDQIAEKRRFALVRDLMLLPLYSASYSTAMRTNYEKFIQPHEKLLDEKLEAMYENGGHRIETRKWLLDRLGLSDSSGPWSRVISIRTMHERQSTSQSIDPDAKEETIFLSLPEATQAVLRARLKVCALEEEEVAHPLFESYEPNMVLLDIRNHIIRMWYRNTRERLHASHALSSVPVRFQALGSRIFTYLECTGVINFGAVPTTSIHRPLPTFLHGRQKKIAIVGAGMAGLIAARQLSSFGFLVSVFEAKGRAGGRVYTEKEVFSAGVDMGAMLILGVIQNPASVLAHQTGSKMHFMDSTCPLFDVNGTWVPGGADKWAEKEFNSVLDATARYRDRKSSEEKANRMSLGYAFQKALEKRARRRRDRLRKYTEEAQNALHQKVVSRVFLGTKEEDDEGEDSDFYLEIPPPRTRKSSSTPAHFSQEYSNGFQVVPGDTVKREAPESELSEVALKKVRVAKDEESEKTEEEILADEESVRHEPSESFATGMQLSLDDKLVSRLLRWHIANLEYACASGIENVSLRHWDQDDPYAFSGEHVLLKTGYMPLVDGLVRGLEQNISYQSKVVSIKYPVNDGMAKLDVQARDGNIRQYEFDSVMISVPLGVLKRGSIRFEPPLPRLKQDAIDRLGFGGLMKVAMEFSHQFWIKGDMFGVLRESVDKRGEFYFFWNLSPSTGSPILVAVVAEPCASAMESLPDVKIKDEALKVLRRCFPIAPEPIAYSISRWSKDEFCGGAYTYIPVGSSGDDYDYIAASVGKSLFFAGEHTCRQYPTTCASAIISGLREAHKVLEAHDMVEHLAYLNAGYLSDDHDSSNKSSNRDHHLDIEVNDSASTEVHIPFARKKIC